MCASLSLYLYLSLSLSLYIYIYIYIYIFMASTRNKRFHSRNQHLRNHHGFHLVSPPLAALQGPPAAKIAPWIFSGVFL